jgi:hypothetical protein
MPYGLVVEHEQAPLRRARVGRWLAMRRQIGAAHSRSPCSEANGRAQTFSGPDAIRGRGGLDDEAVISRVDQYAQGCGQAAPYPRGPKALAGKSLPDYTYLYTGLEQRRNRRQLDRHRKRDETLPRDRRHAGLDLPRRALKPAPVDRRGNYAPQKGGYTAAPLAHRARYTPARRMCIGCSINME